MVSKSLSIVLCHSVSPYLPLTYLVCPQALGLGSSHMRCGLSCSPIAEETQLDCSHEDLSINVEGTMDYTPQLPAQLQWHLGIHIQILCLWHALGYQVTVSENDHDTTPHKV